MVDGAGRMEKKEAWNVSPVGERSCVKGNSKFTGSVLRGGGRKVPGKQ